MSSSAAEATVDRLLARVRESLLCIEKQYRARGRSVADLGVEGLARRMAAAVPAPSPVNELIGPFYRTEQVVRLLGVTRQAIHERTKKGKLLGLRTADGVWVYPVFQFEGRRVLAGLGPVLEALQVSEPVEGEDAGWAAAAWLVSPTSAFDGKTPLEALGAGATGSVVELARDTSQRWRQ